MAVERWKNLETSYVEPYLSNDPSIPHPADLAVIIVGGGTNLSGGCIKLVLLPMLYTLS